LRCEGKSIVCDVNGWSFVKGNNHYYSDCALLLKSLIFSNVRPNDPNFKEARNVGMYITNNEEKGTRVLRSLVGIFRHADRTPKQKLKFVTDDPELL